jgi:hypothetical protein
MFYDDRRVLYFSIHRYDQGLFYPCSKDADSNMVGSDAVPAPLNARPKRPWQILDVPKQHATTYTIHTCDIQRAGRRIQLQRAVAMRWLWRRRVSRRVAAVAHADCATVPPRYCR